jgi:trimethylamine-N-oxide reductase
MRLHSQMANAEPLRKTYAVQTREPLLIKTQDARKRGIRDGDLVELYNERGVNVLDGLGDIWLWPTACRQQAYQSFP